VAGAPPPVVEADPAVESIRPNSGRMVSDIDIANAGREAGFRDDEPSNDNYPGRPSSELAVAVAVALCESRGDATAVGRPGDGSYVIGLWQIKRATLNRSLFIPRMNAQAAYALYNGRGDKFTGTWSAFDSGCYRGNLARAEVAVKGTHRDRPGFTRPDQFPIFGDMLEAISFLVGWITDGQTWIRLGEAIGGAVLILLALILLYHTTKGGTR
jgi:hypothetical protein